MSAESERVWVTAPTERPYLKVPAALLAEPGIWPPLHRNMIVLRVGLYSLVDWDDPRRVLRRADVMSRCLFHRTEAFDGARQALISRGYLELVPHAGGPTEYRLLPGPDKDEIRARIEQHRTHPRNAGDPHPRNAGDPHPRNAGDPHPRNAGDPHPRNAGDPHPRNAGDRLYVQDLSQDLFHHPSTEGGGPQPQDTPWAAIAAALPRQLAERIATRGGSQVVAALNALRAKGWTDAELVAQLLGPEWQDLSSARVPHSALLTRCDVALKRTPPHVDAERAATKRIEQERAAAAAAAARDRAREIREQREAEADGLLAAMTDDERDQLRAKAEAIALARQLTGPDGQPIRAVVHGLMQAIALGDPDPVPGASPHQETADPADGQETTAV